MPLAVVSLAVVSVLKLLHAAGCSLLAVVSVLTLLHAAGSFAAVSVHADVLAPFQTVSK